MIGTGWSRKVINKQVGRLKQMFRWATENELVPPSLYYGLRAVAGLQRGRSDAPETDPVKPVPMEFVDAILPHLALQVAAMVQLQLLTATLKEASSSSAASDLRGSVEGGLRMRRSLIVSNSWQSIKRRWRLRWMTGPRGN